MEIHAFLSKFPDDGICHGTNVYVALLPVRVRVQAEDQFGRQLRDYALFRATHGVFLSARRVTGCRSSPSGYGATMKSPITVRAGCPSCSGST